MARVSIKKIIIIALILIGGSKSYYSINCTENEEALNLPKIAEDNLKCYKEKQVNEKNQIEKKEVQKKQVNRLDSIVQGNNIIESAKGYAVPGNIVFNTLNNREKKQKKEVFLTFDDGPSSEYTPKILNILDEHKVHATFFVLGSRLQSKEQKKIVKRAILSGNAIGNHTYAHNFSKLYPNNRVDVKYFFSDVDRANRAMKNVLGEKFDSKVLRMPGGYLSRRYYRDKNLWKFNEEMAKRKVVSIDWNTETGDATNKNYTVNQLFRNAVNGGGGFSRVVILMHDVKGDACKALPMIIKYYKDRGYEFKVISNPI